MRLILDLCGGTGAWSKPYRDAGYLVEVVTLLEKDVRLFEYPKTPVHGILAAPPCTHFCGSGARWFKQKGQAALLDGLAVVDACLRVITICRPKWWALENPVGRLRHYLGPPALIFQPFEYGDPYTKKTLVWGNFNPPEKTKKVPVPPDIHNTGPNNPKKRFPSKMHLLPPSANRSVLRSITPPGFAQAFFEANP